MARVAQRTRAAGARAQAAWSVAFPGYCKRGFTLLEILIVVMIVGLLAALVGPRLFAQVEKSRQRVAETQIAAFERALGAFRLEVGRLPSSEEGLAALRAAPAEAPRWNGPYLDKPVPPDPWGRPYVYRLPGGEGRDYDITSYGSDGAPGGVDDASDISNR